MEQHGTQRFPIDVDGGLLVRPGDNAICPIVLDGYPEIELSVSFVLFSLNDLTCALIHNYIIPYVNRVYHSSGIRFVIRNCIAGHLIHNINPEATSDEQHFNRRFFTDHEARIQVFFLPEGENQNTAGYSKQLYHPVTDEYVGRGYIVCFEQDNLGRMSNVLAHEIGHLLGLDHRNHPSALMNDTFTTRHDPPLSQEDLLTEQEIQTIRHWANIIRPAT